MLQQPEKVDDHIREIQQALDQALGHAMWYVLGAVVLYIVVYISKDTLAEWYGGIRWKRNVEYRRLDIVYIYEWKEVGCIEYIAAFDSALTMYTIDKDGKVTGGRSIVIPNAQLQKMHIARFKPHLGDVLQIPEFILKDMNIKRS